MAGGKLYEFFSSRYGHAYRGYPKMVVLISGLPLNETRILLCRINFLRTRRPENKLEFSVIFPVQMKRMHHEALSCRKTPFPIKKKQIRSNEANDPQCCPDCLWCKWYVLQQPDIQAAKENMLQSLISP